LGFSNVGGGCRLVLGITLVSVDGGDMAAVQDSSTASSLSPSDQVDFAGRGLFHGLIDGGWWPRSLDLAAELPALLGEMFAAGFDVTHVWFNVVAWEPAACQLIVSGHRVWLHGALTQDGASVRLIDRTGLKPVVVVVIPPCTDPRVAENALELAGRDGDRHRPDQILARAELQTGAAHQTHDSGGKVIRAINRSSPTPPTRSNR
jgi:hypothetical protein